MRLADKQDDTADEIAPRNDAVPPAGKALVVFAETPKAPPAASLTATLIQRRNDGGAGLKVGQIEQRVIPTALEASLVQPAMRDVPDILDEPVGARAQQVILEKAFEDLQPVEATSPIERSEYQSARDSAAGWSLRRSPSSSYWERVIRDVSIFTIFFAVLVLAIFQAL